MKINPNIYAEELRKRNGLDQAFKIADSRMRGTHPSMWGGIPTGVVFYTKDRKGHEGLSEKHLIKLHSFWVSVFHILKKKFNAK